MITNLELFSAFENYKKLEDKLNEGLILTHDIYDASKSLKNNSILWITEPDNSNNTIKFYTESINISDFVKFNTLIFNLGYFISKITPYKLIRGIEGGKTMNYKDFFIDYINNETKSQSIEDIVKFYFVLEPKFDITNKPKTNILYHVTVERFLDKIKKNGLIPKSENFITTHPDRIYFTYDIEDAEKYAKSKVTWYKRINNTNTIQNKPRIGIRNQNDEYIKDKYILLKIDISNIDDLIFYEDPNFKGKGIYTYSTISPKYIEVMDLELPQRDLEAEMLERKEYKLNKEKTKSGIVNIYHRK